MDYFGRLVDDLTDMVESIQDSGNADDGINVIRALERAMRAAVEVERSRCGLPKSGKRAIMADPLVSETTAKLGRAA